MKQNHNSNSGDGGRGPRSGGPQTPEGRKRAAQNSRRHGILSENIVVLRSESEADWEALLNGYLEELHPVGFLETRLVQQMAWAEWREIRAIRVESATIDRQMDNDNQMWQRDCPTVDDDTRTCHAVKQLVDESNDLQHLSRYETRFNRMYHRALKQLLELQEKRRLEGRSIDSDSSVVSKPSAGTTSVAQEPAPGCPAGGAAETVNMNLPNEQPGDGEKQNYQVRNVIQSPETPPPLVLAAA
jgi:hypothetical protein